MKRILTSLLTIALLLAIATPVFAVAADPVQPRFAYINAIDIAFEINESTGIAYCQTDCSANTGVSIVINGTLQQYKNGGWNDVKSWVAVGSRYVSMDKQWAVYSGYQYRFSITVKIYNSAGTLLESHSTSKSYYYPGT